MILFGHTKIPNLFHSIFKETKLYFPTLITNLDKLSYLAQGFKWQDRSVKIYPPILDEILTAFSDILNLFVMELQHDCSFH